MFLFCLYVLCFLVQIFFYAFFFSRFAFYKQKNCNENITSGGNSNSASPVSVIICAKNEAKNLKQNLPAVLEQHYPYFEVVAVNDRSTDDSLSVLTELQKKYSRLKVLSIEAGDTTEGWNKKRAVAAGIDAAQNEILLFTDADCRPAGNLWIQHMAHYFSDGKDIVLGYGAYKRTTGFLNKLIRFDTFFIAMQYFSFALAGNPYMGVGRNLAYRKNIYLKNKDVLKTYEKIPSGDDDLPVNLAASVKNTAIETSPASFTISFPKTTFTDWFRQKSRHLGTGIYYRPQHKFLLGLHIVSTAVWCPIAVYLLFIHLFPVTVISIFLSRLIFQFFVFGKCLYKTGERNLLLISPILETMLAFIIPLIFIFRSQCLTTSKG